RQRQDALMFFAFVELAERQEILPRQRLDRHVALARVLDDLLVVGFTPRDHQPLHRLRPLQQHRFDRVLAEHPLEARLDLPPRRGRAFGGPPVLARGRLVLPGRPRALRRPARRAAAMRPARRIAAMTRRATMSRLLTAGPAPLLAEIGHQILRSGDRTPDTAIAAVRQALSL